MEVIELRINRKIIDCQDPLECRNIKRKYVVIECIINKKDSDFSYCINKAWDLAKKVNPKRANDSLNVREKNVIIIDALGGVLAEYGWYKYINKEFGKIAEFTDFKDSSSQIDLLLSNKKTIEVRSSFPRNGVKFAICNKRYNFKNICKYNNLYKSSEIDKDFFAATLFKTAKENLLIEEEIVFYLIGGSTREMMMDKSISYIESLTAEDDLNKFKTDYKVVKLLNALDILGFEKYIESMGYKKLSN